VNRKAQILSAVGLALLVAVAYGPTLKGGFGWDDDGLITRNRMVHASDGLWRIWFTTEAPDYYPLTGTLWWMEWRLWGDNPTGYHVLNLVLHAVNAILLWTILRRLRVAGAWFAAALFAIHPVNVATVGWVSEQKNTLSMLFYCAAILLYLSFEERKQWSRYALSLAAFLLALLSKTAVVMLPVVLLGCIGWRRGAVRRADVLCSAPFFLVSLVLGLVTVWFQQHRVLGGEPVIAGGFLSRLAMAGAVPWFYLQKALLPFGLNVIYPKWNLDAICWTSFLPGIGLAVGFTLFVWKRARWGRPALFALGCFVATLFPVMGFFDQGLYRVTLVADHWQYHSIAAPLALAAAAGANWLRASRAVVRAGAAVAVIAALTAGTLRRSSVYADQETLWRDTARKNPTAWLAHNNLGYFLERAGRVEAAAAEYREAIRLKPDYADAHNNLGVALTKLGQISAAMEQYQQALKFRPDYAQAHHNLGIALWQIGKLEDSIRHYEEALKIKPDYVEAHDNLAVALAQAGRLDDAIQHWQQALRSDPGYAQAHYNLALTFERLGRAAEATAHYRQALRIRPGFTEAQIGLSRLQATP
jgi:tetratricopeptide (TPR) repeat protein